MIPKTPIFSVGDGYGGEFYKCIDNTGNNLAGKDIARDLTEFYAMKARQEKCDHAWYMLNQVNKYTEGFCRLCGADLTKGATHG